MNQSSLQQFFGFYKTHLLLFVFVVSMGLFAMTTKALANEDRPHWSVELKFGQFHPDLNEWDQFYDNNYMKQYGALFGYKVIRQLEVGLETSYMSENGRGILPLNNQTGGEVDYTLTPVNAFITFRAVFSENQLVVPYVGGGISRMYYKQSVKDGETTKGKTNGTYYKAGMQFLLDRLDTGAAHALRRDFSIDNTYLFLEFSKTTVDIDDVNGNEVDLGGESYFIGLLFEL